MKINKLALLNALSRVRPGLANREMIQQSTSFAFLEGRVTTYNDEISISHPVTGLGMDGIIGAVKADALYAFLNKIKKEEIDIEWEGNQVIVKAGRAKAGLIFETEVTLPLKDEIGDIQKWTPLPDNFMEALKLCHSCASQDMSRPIITCVHLAGNIVEASDTMQIIRYHLPSKIPGKDILLPAQSVRELIKYDIIEMARAESWIHFRTEDGTVFSARTIEGVFPDTTPYLEIEGNEFEFPEVMKEALEKASVFTKNEVKTNDIPTITVEIRSQRIVIKAENSYGWFEEILKSSYTGKSFTFFIGVDFLLDMFSKLQTCIIASDKIGFSGKNWNHIISIRSEQGEE